MKIIHWNVTKAKQPMTGVKRYEYALFESIRELFTLEEKEWQLERIQRAENKITGSTFVSWFLNYRCHDADIIHATEETIAPVAKLRRPKKFVVTCHGLIPLTYPSTIEDITTKIQWTLTPKALTNTDKIIAISEFTKKEIMRITNELGLTIEEDKIDVIHHGIDHAKYYPMNKEKCKKEFDLDPEEKHILVVSSNLEQKRMDIVEKVLGELGERKEEVKLLKAGYAERLKGEGIINIGWITEDKMPMLINAADVYFHPSEYESFGLPILEAMACGVPVVSSNRASIPEIVGNAGEMVDLDAEDVIGQFVEKIRLSLDTGLDKMALERSMEFSWEKTAKETIKVYEKFGE